MPLDVRIATLIFVLAGTLAVPAQAQTASEWLERWSNDQRAALASVGSVTMTEHQNLLLESSMGTRRLGLTTVLTYGSEIGPPERNVTELTIDGKPVDRPPPDRRHRYENPLQEGMQAAVDMMLYPTHVLPIMAPPEEVEMVEFNDQQFVSIRTRAEHPGPGLARVIWWLDPDTGRLVQARAFVEGDDGGALDVSIRYDRIEGVDLPVRKRVEGSFPVRRRMRSFTVLVDVRADVKDHAITRS